MFKKLQNQFLTLNVVSIFTVCIIALSIIYVLVYTNIEKENKEKLEQALSINLAQTTDNHLSMIEATENINSEVFYADKISTNFSVPFNIILNSNNEIIKINSYLDMPEKKYEKILELVLQNINSNKIEYEDKIWMYKIDTFMHNQTTEEKNTEYETMKKISFLDITEDMKMLNMLAITLISIGIIILLIIYFISLCFAKKAIKPIKKAVEKQRQFVANASHELKTPISSIKANTDVLLLNSEESFESQLKWIHHIQYETDKMTNLVNKLLDLAKMENDEEKNTKSKINLSDIVEKSSISIETQVLKNNIQIEKEIENDVIVLQYEELIKQILDILLDNALKYTNVNGRIKIILKTENKKVKIIIQNTGIGITKEDLPHIFDRFYKSDKARIDEKNSYGLGLSIAKIAAEKIGAKILVDSVPNQITTFTILLENNN